MEKVHSMKIDSIVRNFRAFLNGTFPSIRPFMPEESESFQMDDWLQANWELLVESKISDILDYPIILEPYGEGADCNGESSRVTYPNASVTHKIMCLAGDSKDMRDSIDNRIVDFPSFGLPLDCFVAVTNNRYAPEPPFDHVKLETGNDELIIVSESLVIFTILAEKGV